MSDEIIIIPPNASGSIDVEFQGQVNPAHLVPAGGTNGQVLAKASSADYDTRWVNPSGGSGGVQQLFVQSTQPDMVAGQPWQWWQTVGGALSRFYVFDGVI